MISVRHISKSYGKKGEIKALQDVSFEVAPGTLFGLIGPDGAGKTSLFRILTTLLLPDAGEAQVLGFDVKTQLSEIRSRVGYMPGRFSLYQDLSVEENLSFYATLFNTTIEENYHLIKPIYQQIAPFKNRRAGALSGGMKQKLALCCALIHKPGVLFLDEPTTGVDVVSRKEFWEMLSALKKEGITILVSTPYMDEAALCDNIALLHEGKILSIAPPHQIAHSIKTAVWEVKVKKIYTAIRLLEGFTGVASVYPFGESLHITLDDDRTDAGFVEAWLTRAGLPDVTVQAIQPGIEDAFLMMMTDTHKKSQS
ncbi:MAG: ABC transporter ATP-binding protein [Saprospiraceae bacterium]|nr:ABC transporter ATP-binding protein [Saprospiraceae bacterium]MBK8852145.1 ABC transporter ATP-binding protein [Saprospiraceae bacterium]